MKPETTVLTPELAARNAALEEAAMICDGAGRFEGPYDDGEDDYKARSMAKSLATHVEDGGSRKEPSGGPHSVGA